MSAYYQSSTKALYIFVVYGYTLDISADRVLIAHPEKQGDAFLIYKKKARNEFHEKKENKKKSTMRKIRESN